MILSSFPELTGLVVNLTFTDRAEFSLNHEMAVDAFLRHSLKLGEAYSHHLSILTPENGRLYYQAGDRYRFAVIATGDRKQTAPIWHQLIQHLERLPDSAPIKDPKAPLRHNIQLESLHDLFDGKIITHQQSLDAYTLQRAIEQSRAWHKAAQLDQKTLRLHWYWQSTVRLLKADHTTQKGEQRFCRQASDLTEHLLLKRIYESLNHIATAFGLKTHNAEKSQSWLQQQAEFIQIQHPDLFWIDTPYFGKDGQENTLGGLAGHFTLKLQPGIDPDLLAMLILAQMVGIGQRRASGLGKYWLKHNLKALHLFQGTHPYLINRHQSLLEYMTQPHIIRRAIIETEHKPNTPPITEKTHAQIDSAIGQLLHGNYKTPPLQGFTRPKKDGSERLIAVSPLYDRILQKAAAIALSPGLEAIMSQSSYGYRKGLSRQQVRYEIQNAYRQGYRWVFESDIDDFFDSVDRKQLIQRLQSLLGNDPLWPLLEAWLGQDIHYKNTIIKRPKGLPQGSPLSPLLANFILDDFDSDLETHGFKLLRFADDFIVLCKTRQEAELAAQAVKESLHEVKLTLNLEKTHIVELKQGFPFLGYLFREDHAIEIGGEKADGHTTFAPNQAPKNLPPWLANLGDKPIHPIEDEDSPKHTLGDIEEQGTHLVIAGDAQILTTDNHHLIVKKDEIITHQISWEQLHAITLIGLHHMTLPVQHQALAHHIPIHLADRSGQYLGALINNKPAQNNYKYWFMQLQMSDNPEFALDFAKTLVISRLNNQRTTLMRRRAQRKILNPTLLQIKRLQNKAQYAQSLATLNGLEGTATKAYFQTFNHFLPEWAQFQKRTRRPPKDPFNVLLSLGYTILYTHVDSLLQSAGLLTWKGIYHQQSPGHAALASDIMESYRHLVERHAIHTINQGRIKADDFREETNALGIKGLRLSAEARRRYVTTLIQRFQNFSKEQTLHQHLYQQAQHLKKSFSHHQPFNAYKELK